MNLIGGKFLKLLPPVGMAFYFVIHITCRCGKVWPPVIFRMPIRFRKVGTDHKSFVAKSFENIFRNIRVRIVLESAVSDREIGLFRIEQIKTVMMFCSKNHVFHSSIFCDFRPLFGVKLRRIELINEPPIPFLIFVVSNGTVTRYPLFIFRTNRPRFNNAGNRVQSPVKQNAEFEILPPVKLFEYLLVGWPHIFLRSFVNEALLGKKMY